MAVEYAIAHVFWELVLAPVLNELKKEDNLALLKALNAVEVEVVIRRRGGRNRRNVERRGQEERTAVDHRSGKVLAYVMGARQDEVFLQLKTLLEPFGIRQFYTDGWGAYERHLPPEIHNPGKRNTQRIERKHLNLRIRIKRLARKTIGFSKSIQMHDIVIGLFINRYEFVRAV